jgi:hypothetical protein
MGERAPEPLMRNAIIAGLLSALAFAAYWPLDHVTKVLNQNDNFWYVPTAMSLLDEGNFDLNEFERPITELAEDVTYLKSYYGEEHYRLMRRDDGRVFNTYSVMTAIAAAPFVAVLKPVFRKQPNAIWVSIHMSLIIAKIYAAASVGLLFLVAFRLSKSVCIALILALILAFASLNAGQHAGGYWSHNPGTFFVLLGLAALLMLPGRWAGLSGAALAIAASMRPDVIVLIALLTLYVLLHQRKAFLVYALSGAALALVYVLICKATYGEWIQPYPGPTQVLGRDFDSGIFGLLVSPSRGLFIYMPVCLLSLWGMVRCFRDRSDTFVVYRFLALAVLGHWIFLALWPMWWGGWSYGPRLFCTYIPIWLLLTIPFWQTWHAVPRLRRIPLNVAIMVCIAWSAFVEYRGVTDHDVHLWNGMPNDVNDHIDRFWDWSDMQIMRGLGGTYGA